MKHLLIIPAGMVAVVVATSALAGPREDLLAQYGASQKGGGFSAVRGQTLHTQRFTGGKPDTPSCTSCHGPDPRQAGQTLTGKAIEAMAVSKTPTRYTDAAKVEKWFKRNCTEVLGRECTPQEKGDWLTFVMAQ